MGFRGEALPSIASVSRFTLTTRERESDSPEARKSSSTAGKILEVKAAGSAPGTSVEVRQLFFNLPARRKFLRTEETESAHIQHYLTLAALAFPEVAFTFLKGWPDVWQLPAVKSGDGRRSAAGGLARASARRCTAAKKSCWRWIFSVEPFSTSHGADPSEEMSAPRELTTRTVPRLGIHRARRAFRAPRARTSICSSTAGRWRIAD